MKSSVTELVQAARRRLAAALARRQPQPGIARERPFELRLDLADRCNLSCGFCFRHDRVRGEGPEMSTELLDRVASQVFPACHTVFLSCAAEPLVSPLFEPALAMARLHGVPQISLHTNGILMNERRARLCVMEEVHSVDFSLETVDPDRYPRFRDGAKLPLVTRNIDRLRTIRDVSGRTRPEIRLTVIAFKDNLDELTHIADYARARGAVLVHYQHLVRNNPAWTDQCLCFHRDEANRAFDRLRAHVQGWNVHFEIPANFTDSGAHRGPAPRCSYSTGGLFLDIYGNVSPCFKLQDGTFGSLARQELTEILQGPAFARFRRQHETFQLRTECANCIGLESYESEVSSNHRQHSGGAPGSTPRSD